MSSVTFGINMIFFFFSWKHKILVFSFFAYYVLIIIPIQKSKTIVLKRIGEGADLDMNKAIQWGLLCLYKDNFSYYFTLHRGDIATRATPLDPRL